MREQDLVLLHLIAEVHECADDAALIRREHLHTCVLIEIDVAHRLASRQELPFRDARDRDGVELRVRELHAVRLVFRRTAGACGVGCAAQGGADDDRNGNHGSQSEQGGCAAESQVAAHDEDPVENPGMMSMSSGKRYWDESL